MDQHANPCTLEWLMSQPQSMQNAIIYSERYACEKLHGVRYARNGSNVAVGCDLNEAGEEFAGRVGWSEWHYCSNVSMNVVVSSFAVPTAERRLNKLYIHKHTKDIAKSISDVLRKSKRSKSS